MSVDATRGKFALRAAAFVALTAAMLWGSGSARAYHPIRSNGIPVKWTVGSPTTIFDQFSQTVTWALYTSNFPKNSWPTAAQVGGAFQNATQTLTDITGKTLNFRRTEDTSTPPSFRDGILTYAFVEDETSDFYQNDISPYLGVTYVEFDVVTGVLVDGDMFFNADPTSNPPKPDWSTVGAPGTTDVEATAVHESMHVAGSGHTPYFSAKMFPRARAPVAFFPDHILSPDDRAYFRAHYPPLTPVNGTLSGSVTITGAGVADRAIVVATDANDIPQAIMATLSDGTFTGLSVPPGNYTLTVFHGSNTDYFQSSPDDIDYTSASPFVTAGTVGPVAVTSGNNTAAPVITATTTVAGPGMSMTFQSLSPANPQYQVIFVSSDPADPSHAGTMNFLIDTPVGSGNIATGSIASVSLGNGITPGAAIATVWNTDVTLISVPYTVSPTAVPGERNLIINLNVNGNERLFIPGAIKVIAHGGLVMAATAGNPAASGRTAGNTDVPLLGLSLQAVAPTPANNEDVRIRRLAFTIAGSGQALTSVKLWVDAAPLGVGGGDTRLVSGDAYANAGILETTTVSGWGSPPGSAIFDNLALTVPAGTTLNLLLTADLPATGTGAYTASLDPAGTDTTGAPNIIVGGMFWGDQVIPTGGAVVGGTQSTVPIAVNGLAQVRTTGGAAVPVGGSTNENQITLRGTVTTSAGGFVGMDVEHKLVGSNFTGTPTMSALADQPSGTTFSLNVTGLTLGSTYHWRARPVSSVTGAGIWVNFGSNPESAFDFSYDTSTTNPPSTLLQFEKDGTTPVAQGGLVKGKVLLSAINGTNSAGGQVRLEVEVRLDTVAFTGTPTVFSGFGPSGGADTAAFTGHSGTYHWQARTANQLGTSSTWVNFDPTTPHFDFKGGGGGGGGSGGCGATIPAGTNGLWWGLVALGLLAIFAGRRTV